MASYLPQSAHPQDVLFKSHDDAKYLGDEMGYTYGDNKQKMTTKAQDASILIRNAPAHLLPVVKKFLTGQSVVSQNVELSENPTYLVFFSVGSDRDSWYAAL